VNRREKQQINATGAQYNSFRYHGYCYDTDLGLYYLNSRYYDSNIGRFISPDRIDVLAATPDQLTDKNLYAYCDNNSITREDGDGEFWHILAGALIGGIINATISWVDI
jgi:RHS repeat-associated protein